MNLTIRLCLSTELVRIGSVFAVCFPFMVDDRVNQIHRILIRKQQCYGLQAGILVWNFTFHTRNSKPENLLSGTLT